MVNKNHSSFWYSRFATGGWPIYWSGYSCPFGRFHYERKRTRSHRLLIGFVTSIIRTRFLSVAIMTKCLYGANIDGLDGNVHYLCNSGIELPWHKILWCPNVYELRTEQQSLNYAQYQSTPMCYYAYTAIWHFRFWWQHYGSDELHLV